MRRCGKTRRWRARWTVVSGSPIISTNIVKRKNTLSAIISVVKFWFLKNVSIANNPPPSQQNLWRYTQSCITGSIQEWGKTKLLCSSYKQRRKKRTWWARRQFSRQCQYISGYSCWCARWHHCLFLFFFLCHNTLRYSVRLFLTLKLAFIIPLITNRDARLPLSIVSS